MPAGHTSKHAHRPYVYSMPAYHTTTARPQAEPTQCARRPHVYTCPQAKHLQHARGSNFHSVPAGHTFTRARRLYIYYLPAGHTSAPCPQAIYTARPQAARSQYARWPYIYSMPAGQYTCNMPAGHILQYAQYILQQTGLASNSRPQAISTCYNLVTSPTTNCPQAYLFNLPAGPTLSNFCRLNTCFSKLDH